eukprot:980615-Rhodomonas_salina.1
MSPLIVAPRVPSPYSPTRCPVLTYAVVYFALPMCCSVLTYAGVLGTRYVMSGTSIGNAYRS